MKSKLRDKLSKIGIKLKGDDADGLFWLMVGRIRADFEQRIVCDTLSSILVLLSIGTIFESPYVGVRFDAEPDYDTPRQHNKMKVKGKKTLLDTMN